MRTHCALGAAGQRRGLPAVVRGAEVGRGLQRKLLGEEAPGGPDPGANRRFHQLAGMEASEGPPEHATLPEGTFSQFPEGSAVSC